MQDKGTTNPSEHVKEVTRTLVRRLSEIDGAEKVEIEVVGGVSRFVQVGTGEVLAELHDSKK